MPGETNLQQLLATLQPKLQPGDYVFCTVSSLEGIPAENMIGSFKEEEGITIIIKKELAEALQFPYSFVTAWITLTVHSSLEATGLTAAFAAALTKENISCNVVAAFYHDHIFVNEQDAAKAMDVLGRLAHNNKPLA